MVKSASEPSKSRIRGAGRAGEDAEARRLDIPGCRTTEVVDDRQRYSQARACRIAEVAKGWGRIAHCAWRRMVVKRRNTK